MIPRPRLLKVLIILLSLALAAGLSACQDQSSPTATAIPAVSTTPAASATPALYPADAPQPAAGICAEPPETTVWLALVADVPTPRCVKITAGQQIGFVNNTSQPLEFRFAQHLIQLQPGQSQLINAAAGAYLAPGVHWTAVTGNLANAPELWLISQ